MRGVSAMKVAWEGGHEEIGDWLERTDSWTTRLHHLELLTEAQARAELRAGADLHAADEDALWHSSTPLSIARKP